MELEDYWNEKLKGSLPADELNNLVEKLSNTQDIGYLQRFFGANFLYIKEFDLSAIGFHNWVNHYYPHLVKKNRIEELKK